MKKPDLQHLRQATIDQAMGYYERLSDRERLIVVVSGVALITLSILIFFGSMIGSINRLERRIARESEVVQTIERLKVEYAKSRTDVGRLESVVRRTPSTFSLSSHLESIAQQYNIKPESMSPKPVPPIELYREVQVEVKIGKVNLRELTDYLYSIESSNQIIRVNSISIKPNSKNPAFLNAVFSVSAFMAKE